MTGKRILIDSKYRREIFSQLKNFHGVNSYKDLAQKLKISYSGLKKWLDGYCYVPLDIIPKEFVKENMIIDLQPDGWGRSKGGKIGIKRLGEKYPPEIIKKWRRKGWEKNKKIFEEWRKKGIPNIGERIRQGRLKSRKNRIFERMKVNKSFFKFKYPTLILNDIHPSHRDLKKNLKLPKTLNENLAEEIGIHIGDGTLIKSKNYFAVRGNVNNEYEYYKSHICNLYKTLYNFAPRIFIRGSICGFEISSSMIFQFKTKILGIPCGKKSHIIDIPNIIKESKNERIIGACLRGIFDSDGCIYFAKKGTYPRIIIDSQSQRLIKTITFFLKKIGFEPNIYKNGKRIVLNGPIMLELWLDKIGTNQLKNKLKIGIWKKFGYCPSKLSYKELKELHQAPVV